MQHKISRCRFCSNVQHMQVLISNWVCKMGASCPLQFLLVVIHNLLSCTPNNFMNPQASSCWHCRWIVYLCLCGNAVCFVCILLFSCVHCQLESLRKFCTGSKMRKHSSLAVSEKLSHSLRTIVEWGRHKSSDSCQHARLSTGCWRLATAT